MFSADINKYIHLFILSCRRTVTSGLSIALIVLAAVLGSCSPNVMAQGAAPNPIVPAPKTGEFDPYFDSQLSLGEHQRKYYKACTIYIYIKSFLSVEIINMSTFKISSCPDHEFRHITAASVMAQLKTVAPVTLVSMNGPYYQLMDENNSVIDSAFVSIGNLNFTPVMRAQISYKDLLTNFSSLMKWRNVEVSYNPIATRRNMNFVWYKDSTIYTLVSDTGKHYVMAYFSPPEIDRFQNAKQITDKLDNLGNILNLPAGWRYEVIVLPKILRLTQIPERGYISETLMDELENVYIRFEPDQF